MSDGQIKRVLNAAYRQELGALRSIMAASRYSNPVGRAAIRSGQCASRKMAKAQQLRLGLEMRCQSEANEKRRKLSKASKEFRAVAPWKTPKKKRKQVAA